MPRPPRLALLLLFVLCLPGQAFAHERWVRHALLSDFDRTLFETANPTNLWSLAAVAILGLLLIAQSVRLRKEFTAKREGSSRLSDWGATILGTFAGFGLLVPALDGQFIAPDLVVDSSAAGVALIWGGGLVGVLFLLGLWVRPAAGLLIGLYCLAIVALPFELFDGESVPPVAILNYLDVVGIALFVGMIGRGALSLDRIFFLRPRASATRWSNAVGLLRISLGLTLALLGVQKFLMPELPMGVVQNYQDQIYEPIARITGMSPEIYVFAASVIELTVGLLLLIGVFTRLWTLVVAGLFLTTAMIFRSELIGHLPLFGLAIVLLIEGGGGLRLDDEIRRHMGGAGKGMPNATVASLLLIVTMFGAMPGCAPDSVEASLPQWKGTEHAFSIAGEEGRCRFEIIRQVEPVSLNQFFTLQTRVFDADSGEPLGGGSFQLDARMPDHEHGMASQPLTIGPTENLWRTNGCKLHMYGRWVFQVDWKAEGVEDRASFEFQFTAPERGGSQ